jgi:CRP/FNR family transcriptional regulator, cyclic AMP receptor protein
MRSSSTATTPADSLHLIVKGRFAIRVMTQLGETVTLALRGPGESFGEMALVSPRATRSATLIALEEAETFAVYQTVFAQLRSRHPTVNELLLAFLANEVRFLDERL